MSLTTKIRHLLAAAGFATLTACATTPSPVCSYVHQAEETQEHRTARLGHTIGDGCEEIIPGHNDTRQRRINIIFVGMNYTLGQFTGRFQDAVDCRAENRGFLATEPFHSNAQSFNFWHVPQMGEVELGDELDGFGREAFGPGLELASACNLPDRAIFIMANWGFRANASHPAFSGIHFEQMDLENLERLQYENRDSSMWGCRRAADEFCYNSERGMRTQRLCDAFDELRGRQDRALDRTICGILVGQHNIQFGVTLLSVNSRPGTAVHEAGHLLLDLTDEYLEEGRIASEDEAQFLEGIQAYSHNCYAAETQEACEQNAPWSDMVAECYQGCRYVMKLDGVPVWRSVDRGTMNYGNAGFLGLWNELRACHVIDVVTHNATGYCQQFGFVPSTAERAEPGVADIAGHTEYLMATIDERTE